MKEQIKRDQEEKLSTVPERQTMNDTELVLRSQNGDTGAFEKLVERYDRRVLSLAFSFTRNSDDAKDIYQETLIRAYNSIKKFKMESEFSTWLYRIATNVCISFKYRKSRTAEMFIQNHSEADDGSGHGAIASSSNTAEGDFMRAELAIQIETALGKLSPMQRLVFTMKHYEGYLLREIAAMANCTEGTVKKHLYVAVRKLQNELRAAID